MRRSISYGIKTIIFTIIVILMLSLTGAFACAESLDDNNLTMAPLWYQPHVLASIEEAASNITFVHSLFSDWKGFEIKQLSIDLSGVRILAVLNAEENIVAIPAKDIINVIAVHLPFLDRDNKFGIKISFKNGPDIVLRARTLDAAQKVVDSLVTLAIANGCKLPSPVGLICHTENTAAEFTRLQWTGKGALVSAVFPGSPADLAGLKRDDIVVEVNNQPVTDPAALAGLVNQSLENRPESKLELKLFRDGQTLTQSVTLKNLYYGVSVTSSNQKSVATGNTAPQSLGISARNLTAEEAKKAGLAEQTGIYITSVDAGSTAEQMGMKPGDYLLEINGQKVANVGVVKQILSTGAVIQDLKIWRYGQVMTLNGVNKL